MPVRLTEEYMRTFAEHLPRICEDNCGNEQYSCVDGDFKLQTWTYHVASVNLGNKYISLHLTELRYMMYMFHVVHNQQILYVRALSDVITYAHAAQHRQFMSNRQPVSNPFSTPNSMKNLRL